MKSKYSAVKTEVDGIKFPSKKEAKRYGQLKMLLLAKEITDLRLQVPYELNPGGTFSYKYIADFVYNDKAGKEIIEDCKGFRTAVYRKKAKLMKKVYGIEIKET
jgi:hypothetical protein